MAFASFADGALMAKTELTTQQFEFMNMKTVAVAYLTARFIGFAAASGPSRQFAVTQKSVAIGREAEMERKK
jgi:hypothetical protein